MPGNTLSFAWHGLVNKAWLPGDNGKPLAKKSLMHNKCIKSPGEFKKIKYEMRHAFPERSLESACPFLQRKIAQYPKNSSKTA